MSRPLPALLGAAAACLAAALAASPPRPAAAQQADGADATAPAQFFTINEPITDTVLANLKASVLPYLDRAAAERFDPILVFEFRSGDANPGATDLFGATRLAEFLSTQLSRAKLTVAYVPRAISGYAVLPVLACDEIVLGSEASLGPITLDGQAVSPLARTAVETLAKRKGRDLDLLLGLLEPQADLREVRTADGRTRFVRADQLDAFRREHQVLAEKPAWEGGRRGVLLAERARGLQVANVLADSRAKVVQAYNLDPQAAAGAPQGPLRPLLIGVEGPIDEVKRSYIERRVGQAVRDQKVNMIVLRFNSEGGQKEPAERIAEMLTGLKPQGVQTVAFIDEQALGLAAYVALACDEVVMRRGAKLGEVTHTVGGSGDVQVIAPEMQKVIADQLARLAREKAYPEAVVRAMADPSIEVLAARDNDTGAVIYVTSDEVAANPNKFAVQGTVKPAGETLSLDADRAKELGIARQVVGSLDEWLAARGLEGIKADQPTWVDTLVTTLNTPWMSGLLLFVGLFMLILELKLPGVGLPAIVSALAFLLFFWSHYLGGTADRLEIILFAAGLVSLAIELFVLPGFGVFGVSGILLVLTSVVMASHTFIWPTRQDEYRQMGWTLAQVTGTIIAVVVGAVILGRYFPSLPIFRRMILVPESATETALSGKPAPEPGGPLTFLLGERGRTTTDCRPIGRARFGDLLVDVSADGFFIEANTPVEVIEVRGAQVVVRRV
jgi:membrane-bound serine protease (ClpP class)